MNEHFEGYTDTAGAGSACSAGEILGTSVSAANAELDGPHLDVVVLHPHRRGARRKIGLVGLHHLERCLEAVRGILVMLEVAQHRFQTSPGLGLSLLRILAAHALQSLERQARRQAHLGSASRPLALIVGTLHLLPGGQGARNDRVGHLAPLALAQKARERVLGSHGRNLARKLGTDKSVLSQLRCQLFAVLQGNQVGDTACQVVA